MSNLGLGLLWMLCALWMVQEICALLSTNQIQSFSQVQFCHFFLPHALGVCLFLLQVLMGAMLYFLSSDGLLWVLWFLFYCTQSKKTVQKGEYSKLMLTAVNYKDLPTSDSRSICFLPKKISLHSHSSLEFFMDNFCNK